MNLPALIRERRIRDEVHALPPLDQPLEREGYLRYVNPFRSMLLRARDWSIRACAFNFLTQYAAIMPKSRSLSLCSSRRRKLSLQSKVSLPPALPPGIYNRDINLPPGIRNGANICYAISVLQCLFNHPTFRDVFEEVCAFHEKQQGSNCFSCGMMLMYSV